MLFSRRSDFKAFDTKFLHEFVMSALSPKRRISYFKSNHYSTCLRTQRRLPDLFCSVCLGPSSKQSWKKKKKKGGHSEINRETHSIWQYWDKVFCPKVQGIFFSSLRRAQQVNSGECQFNLIDVKLIDGIFPWEDGAL